MDDKLINEAAQLFDEYEKWESFNELSNMRDRIILQWVKKANLLIRDHFHKTRNDTWCCVPYGNTDWDSRWYLNKFGVNSLGITIGWYYELVLDLPDGNDSPFDTNAISEELKKPEYNPIHMAFDRIDPWQDARKKLIECRNYHFGCLADGGIIDSKLLAWFAGNQTDDFVSQVIKKVERFTCDQKITGLLMELNEKTRVKA
jgi:hypothetical protein